MWWQKWRELQVPIVRWPGAEILVSGYHWLDGVGPQEKRRRQCWIAHGNTLETNQFGSEVSFLPGRGSLVRNRSWA